MVNSFPNRGDWRSPPTNRRTFHNVESIIPTDLVASEPSERWPFQEVAKSWHASIVQRRLLNFTRTDALVVLADGTLRFEYYANENGPRTKHILMSCSKAVIGLLVSLLFEDGTLDPKAPVERYLTEIVGTRYAGVTARDLIDMRAGVVLSAAEQRAYDLATRPL
jgi:CubicO group peptidase (beta-lactamase class C family)